MKTTSRNLRLRSTIFRRCLLTLIKGCLLLSSFYIVSCSSTSIRQDQAERGEWEARVLVHDKKQSKRFIVNADFLAAKPDQLRMDITTPLGVHVASVAMTNGKMTYIVPQQKAYYEGRASAQAFARTLNFAIDPKLILNVLFDQPVQQKGWKCKMEEPLVSECALGAYKITWSNRRAQEKSVIISHPQYQVELKFHKFKVPSSIKETVFTIKKPEGFQVVQ